MGITDDKLKTVVSTRSPVERHPMAANITGAEFDSVLANATKPVLVDFWAPWCGPCRALGPIVEEVAHEMADRLDVYKCDVDNEAELASRFRIVSIPTLIVFKDGEPVHTMVGSMPKAELVQELQKVL
jgi:thioredoxin 1